MPRQFERLWWCALAVLMGLTNAWGQTSTLHLYDNFDAAFLNPAKWSPTWQCGGTVMDCVRDIEDDALRLKVRAYGATDSSDGTQVGFSQLYLTKNNVKDIAAEVVVHRSSVDGCSTNPGFGGGGGHAQFLMYGAFFNGGGGTSNDDVQAFIQLDRYATYDAGTFDVGGLIGYQGQFSNVDFGEVNIGEKFTVELAWDQPNHRFVIRLTRPSQGTVQDLFMPYTVSDVTPAAAPFRSLGAFAVPANCLGTRTSATLDVAVTKVMTN